MHLSKWKLIYHMLNQLLMIFLTSNTFICVSLHVMSAVIYVLMRHTNQTSAKTGTTHCSKLSHQFGGGRTFYLTNTSDWSFVTNCNIGCVCFCNWFERLEIFFSSLIQYMTIWRGIQLVRTSVFITSHKRIEILKQHVHKIW